MRPSPPPPPLFSAAESRPEPARSFRHPVSPWLRAWVCAKGASNIIYTRNDHRPRLSLSLSYQFTSLPTSYWFSVRVLSRIRGYTATKCLRANLFVFDRLWFNFHLRYQVKQTSLRARACNTCENKKNNIFVKSAIKWGNTLCFRLFGILASKQEHPPKSAWIKEDWNRVDNPIS